MSFQIFRVSLVLLGSFPLNYLVSIFSIVLAHSKQETMTSSEQNSSILFPHKSQTKLFLGSRRSLPIQSEALHY